MKFLVLILGTIFFTSAMAHDSKYALENFESALKTKIGDLSKSEELRLNIYKNDLPFCDSAGPTLVAELEVRRSQNAQRSYYEKIKTYYVSLAEANQLTTSELNLAITSDDECLD